MILNEKLNQKWMVLT